MQHQNANYAWICQTEQHSTSIPLPRKDIWKWKRSKCEAKLPLLRQSFASPQGSTPCCLGIPCQLFIYYMSKIVVLGVRFWPPYSPSVDVASNNHRPFGPCLNTAPAVCGGGDLPGAWGRLKLGG